MLFQNTIVVMLKIIILVFDLNILDMICFSNFFWGMDSQWEQKQGQVTK